MDLICFFKLISVYFIIFQKPCKINKQGFFYIKVFIFKENGSFDYKGLKMADLNKDGIIDVRDVTELQKNYFKIKIF